jgi:hypothetical protein
LECGELLKKIHPSRKREEKERWLRDADCIRAGALESKQNGQPASSSPEEN